MPAAAAVADKLHDAGERLAAFPWQQQPAFDRLAAEAGVNFDDFRYKSICRLNILERIK